MEAMWNSSFDPQLKPARYPSSVLQCRRGNVFSTLSVIEGCLNFGTLKVFEENKLTLKIKNQGKYDIAFKWVSDALFLAAGNVLARLCLRKFSEYSNEYMFVFFPSMRFLIQQTAPTLPDLASVFTVSPQSGILKSHDKASTLHIFCRPNAEFTIREQPILACQVRTPFLSFLTLIWHVLYIFSHKLILTFKFKFRP